MISGNGVYFFPFSSPLNTYKASGVSNKTVINKTKTCSAGKGNSRVTTETFLHINRHLNENLLLTPEIVG